MFLAAVIEQVLLRSWLLPGSHSRSNSELRNISSEVKKMKFNNSHAAALPLVQPQLAPGARQESPVQVSAGLSVHRAGTIRCLRRSQCSHTLMCLYILLRFTKPEYKYLYIFNGKVMYPPKRKIDVINHLSEKLPDS